MLTYQDLIKVGENKKDRMNFVKKAILQHKTSDFYKNAYDADLYCKHKNVTISKYQKLLYTMSGKTVPDNWSANFKMASRFFHRFVTQENQFLLGNGVNFEKQETKEKLGNKSFPIDTQLQKLGKSALTEGVSFGFFNLDHIEVFSFLEFVPLYDEEDGSLKAGIRFWQIDDKKPLRATLYELDGYTKYIWNREERPDKTEDGEILEEKRTYKLKYRETDAEGIEIYDFENYNGFPIVPLWANTHHQSELVGLREQIDCYDLIKSGFANTVDEASIVYWTLTNAGGMDDIDLAKFVERMKTVHAVRVDDDVQAESHTVDAPFQSREALLDRLERDLYKDAMALNTYDIANGTVTATQIKAAYEPLNSKTDDFEYCVNEFLNRILVLAGIDDKFSFTRSKIVNVSEEVTTILQSASYLDSEYVTEKILTILGDTDRIEEVLKNIDSDDIKRFNELDNTDSTEEENINNNNEE